MSVLKKDSIFSLRSPLWQDPGHDDFNNRSTCLGPQTGPGNEMRWGAGVGGRSCCLVLVYVLLK